MIEPAVAWFGPQFERLHPALQRLHREGGALHGEIDLRLGRGLGGIVGRRLARRLGLPPRPGHYPFAVEIGHAGGSLLWTRRFGAGPAVVSRFVPQGRWPDGHWCEQQGPLTLELGVDLDAGGWQWRLRRLRLYGLPIPAWLAPRTTAGKRIVDGRYRFEVAFRLPWLGEVLRYNGDLLPSFAAQAARNGQ